MSIQTQSAEIRGGFYKAAITKDNPAYFAIRNKELLGDFPDPINAAISYDGYIPVTLSSEITGTPFAENPLRSHITITNAPRLEVPKMIYTYDVDFIEDGETAREMELSAELVDFGRHKIKALAAVGDTVIHGSLPTLAVFIEHALHSSLALKERKAIFNTEAPTNETHMSFYGAGIKSVSGSGLIDSIWAAYEDLEDVFKPNATVVMRRTDWIHFLRERFGSSTHMWSASAQDTIGLPVVFVEDAVRPIVGDLRFLHLNYDIASVYETQRKPKKGVYYFVFTSWFDVQFLLKSAFRIAGVDMDTDTE